MIIKETVFNNEVFHYLDPEIRLAWYLLQKRDFCFKHVCEKNDKNDYRETAIYICYMYLVHGVSKSDKCISVVVVVVVRLSR